MDRKLKQFYTLLDCIEEISQEGSMFKGYTVALLCVANVIEWIKLCDWSDPQQPAAATGVLRSSPLRVQPMHRMFMESSLSDAAARTPLIIQSLRVKLTWYKHLQL